MNGLTSTIKIARYRCTKGHEWTDEGLRVVTGTMSFPDLSDKLLCQRCWWEWMAAHLGEVTQV